MYTIRISCSWFAAIPLIDSWCPEKHKCFMRKELHSACLSGLQDTHNDLGKNTEYGVTLQDSVCSDSGPVLIQHTGSVFPSSGNEGNLERKT